MRSRNNSSLMRVTYVLIIKSYMVDECLLSECYTLECISDALRADHLQGIDRWRSLVSVALWFWQRGGAVWTVVVWLLSAPCVPVVCGILFIFFPWAHREFTISLGLPTHIFLIRSKRWFGSKKKDYEILTQWRVRYRLTVIITNATTVVRFRFSKIGDNKINLASKKSPKYIILSM